MRSQFLTMDVKLSKRVSQLTHNHSQHQRTWVLWKVLKRSENIHMVNKNWMFYDFHISICPATVTPWKACSFLDKQLRCTLLPSDLLLCNVWLNRYTSSLEYWVSAGRKCLIRIHNLSFEFIDNQCLLRDEMSCCIYSKSSSNPNLASK